MTTPIYDLDTSYGGEPSTDERPLLGKVVRFGPVAPGALEQHATRVGSIALSIAPADDNTSFVDPDGWIEREGEFLVEPVVSAREAHVAIDGRVRAPTPWPDHGSDKGATPLSTADVEALHVAAPPPLAALRDVGDALPSLGFDAARSLRPDARAPTRVAVLDASFAQLDGLGSNRVGSLERISFGGSVGRVSTSEVGHGTAMSTVILIASDASVVPIQLGASDTAHYEFIGASLVAFGIARACEAQADVVLLASNWTSLGSPRHLRRVLAEAAHYGYDGRGILIVCSAGDHDQSQADGSWALPADDLTAQPWALTVGACGHAGEWGRRGHQPITRLGPSIELTAPSEQFGAKLGAVAMLIDDTSGASALVAAAASVVRSLNRHLTAIEVRDILCGTARRPAAVEPDPDLPVAAGCADFDRTGHNFKVGYGTVDVLRAALTAIDPVCGAFIQAGHPDASRLHDNTEPGINLALKWSAFIDASKSALVVEYRAVWGPRMSRAFANSSAVRRVLMWCARHLVELARSPSPTWPVRAHAALVQRALVALWACVDWIEHAGPEREERTIRRFAEDLEHTILATDGRVVSDFLAHLIGG